MCDLELLDKLPLFWPCALVSIMKGKGPQKLFKVMEGTWNRQRIRGKGSDKETERGGGAGAGGGVGGVGEGEEQESEKGVSEREAEILI